MRLIWLTPSFFLLSVSTAAPYRTHGSNFRSSNLISAPNARTSYRISDLNHVRSNPIGSNTIRGSNAIRESNLLSALNPRDSNINSASDHSISKPIWVIRGSTPRGLNPRTSNVICGSNPRDSKGIHTLDPRTLHLIGGFLNPRGSNSRTSKRISAPNHITGSNPEGSHITSGLKRGVLKPISDSNPGTYTVTILNDSSVGDLTGAVHTWLRIRCSRDVTYFSFTSADFKRGLLGGTVAGKSSVDEKLQRRRPNEEITLKITREQHQAMLQAIEEFYRTRPRYSMLPRDSSSYNCVTAADRILRAAGIHLLRGYRNPVFLGLKLATVGSVLRKCLAAPNLFMFLNLTLFSSMCLFL